MYDETENFKQYYDAQFNYPFDKRKSKLNTYMVSTDTGDTNYQYSHQQIDFMISQVCLEKDPFEDLAIWNPISVKLKEIMYGVTDSSNQAFYCDSGTTPITKIKYQSTTSSSINYGDYYEGSVISDKILLEFQLGLSAYKIVSSRSSTMALDLFGDLGGFHQCVDVAVFMFGEWFAFKFFL